MNIDKNKLRIAIAEKMGALTDACPECYGTGRLGNEGDCWPCDTCGATGRVAPHPTGANYLTDLNAAWQLVEWMQDKGNLAPIITPLGKGATVQLHLNGEVVSANTASLAICLAFAKANHIPIPQLTT